MEVISKRVFGKKCVSVYWKIVVFDGSWKIMGSSNLFFGVGGEFFSSLRGIRPILVSRDNSGFFDVFLWWEYEHLSTIEWVFVSLSYLYVYVGVSKNRGTPKSSILIGFSIIFTIHFGVFPPIFGNTHVHLRRRFVSFQENEMWLQPNVMLLTFRCGGYSDGTFLDDYYKYVGNMAKFKTTAWLVVRNGRSELLNISVIPFKFHLKNGWHVF